MVEGNQESEHRPYEPDDTNIELVAARLNKVDSKILSPSQRADKIFSFIKTNMPEQPSVWDVVCFASEYVGSQVSMLPFLEVAAKELLMLVYAFHYEYPATIDPTYSDDESNSNTGEAEANVNDAGHNSRNESHG